MMRADLHSHSYYSDGELSPYELVKMAKNANLEYFALTDHDCLMGISEAIEAGKELGITVITGIELSCYFSCDVHILGYGIDYKDKNFIEILEKVQEKRTDRNYLILEKLKEFNINIDKDEFDSHCVGRVAGRTQIGELMVIHGYVKSVKDAFDYYLASGKRAFINAFRLTPEEAVKYIRSVGGIPVLAHPNQLRMGKPDLFDFVHNLKKHGLMGVETYYYTHSAHDIKFYEKLTSDLGLINTAGSDYHGKSRNSVLGRVPREMSEEMKKIFI